MQILMQSRPKKTGFPPISLMNAFRWCNLIHIFEMFAQKVSDLSTSEVIFANLQWTHFLNWLENSTLSRLTHSDKETGFFTEPVAATCVFS